MSYVYFILDEKSKAIKIGKANNIDERLSGLQTGNPNSLKLIHSITCKNEDHSFVKEKQLHKKFEHLQMTGEWFKYTDELVNYIDDLDINYTQKEKRTPLIINTLFEEEGKQIFGPKHSPSCYFYPNLTAQIMHNYEAASKMKIPFRTMEYPTHGKSMLLPYSDEKNRVFISHKKHEEIMELNRLNNIKNKSPNLEQFFG